MRAIFLLCLVFFLAALVRCQLQIIKDVLQFNLVGHPTVHQSTSWYFDPDVGVRRSKKYQELNGRYGEKAIERLGLGIDGREDERLEEQQERDTRLGIQG